MFKCILFAKKLDTLHKATYTIQLSEDGVQLGIG